MLQDVSSLMSLSLLLSASTQAASFDPLQYLDDENTVSSFWPCCTCKNVWIKTFLTLVDSKLV